jgi:hypothetical protein
MTIVLKNKRLRIDIDEPGENYKFARFDHTGNIVQVILDDKHSFCANEIINGFNKDKNGQGFYNEFGISDPVGYDDCPVGGQFPKIGVGLLLKPDEKPYYFLTDYEILPFKVNIIKDDEWVEFTSNPNNSRGYEVRYKKLIKLAENSFTIHYELQNTGSKPFNTSEYCHNFVAINNSHVDENYTLKFPFKLDKSVTEEYVNEENAIVFKDKRMKFEATPEQPFFFSHLEYDKELKGIWEITNDKYGVGVKETTDFVPCKINVWGWKHVISPELFYKVTLNPGQQISWQRKYEFYYL